MQKKDGVSGANAFWSIPVRNDLRPDYYDSFHCLAAECRFSCCVGWKIPFDKKDYLSLKRQSGSEDLNQRLEGGVRRIRRQESIYYGEFNMSSGICPLLGEDHLCTLQKECGHGALPNVCKTFPRAEEYLPSGYLERSLSPACEGVLALLWERPDGIGFVSDPLSQRDGKLMSVSDPASLYPDFQTIREWCIDLLQDRRFSLPQRIFLMGAALKDLADGEEDIDRWLGKARVLLETPGAAELLDKETAERSLPLFLSNQLHLLSSIRTLAQYESSAKYSVMGALHPERIEGDEGTIISLAAYRNARERYQENFGDRDYFMENLMVSLFFHLHMPVMGSRELLWKNYVNFCNLYSFYRFLSVMSCREGAAGDRDELFRLMVFASRALIHNGTHQMELRDELFQNDSATLAHMAVLLSN